VKAFPFGSLPSRYLMIGSAMLVAAAAWTVFRLIPVLRPTPTVSTFLELTNDGRAKQGPLIVDGSRILFSENLPGPQLVLAEASSRGGETNTKSYPLQQPRWADISRDGSEVLALNSNSETPYAVWIIPVAGGSARRVGTFQAEDATWCPDGNTIVYSTHAGNEIRLVNKDGTSDRKLVTVPGIGSRLRWSPDGRTLRFTVTDQKSDSTSLWQVSADGTGLRPLLPGWNPRASQCCGEWTRDAQHFLFQSTLDGRTDIWEIPEKTGLWPKRNRAPFRLTSGPMNFSDPIQSQDGKKLFVIGISPRAELVRYDSRTGEFVPFMPGLSAEGVTVSNDGQWLTYVSYPDGTVWRCKVDGSEKLQLSFAPLRALLPRWSPDGKQIVFFATAGDQPWKMYLVPFDGGTPHQLLPGLKQEGDPTWTADGTSIVFGTLPWYENSEPGIRVLDLQTHGVSKLPLSDGLFSPRSSPVGRDIVALTHDRHDLMIFNPRLKKWDKLIGPAINYPSFSRDGKYVYFQDWRDYLQTEEHSRGNGPVHISRIRLSDRKVENILEIRSIGTLAIGTIMSWSGLAPDDSPLVARDISSQELYSLDWPIF